MKRFILILCFFLSSCMTAPKSKDFIIMDYQGAPAFNLSLSQVEIGLRPSYKSRLPHIEHTLLITPTQAIENYISNRFVPQQTGGKYKLVVLIEEASLLQTIDEKEWYQQDNQKYTLNFAVRFQFYEKERLVYEQFVKGYEMNSIPKRSSLKDKEKIWAELISDMLIKINDKLEIDLRGLM